jgi:hypothetical protein
MGLRYVKIFPFVTTDDLEKVEEAVSKWVDGTRSHIVSCRPENGVLVCVYERDPVADALKPPPDFGKFGINRKEEVRRLHAEMDAVDEERSKAILDSSMIQSSASESGQPQPAVTTKVPYVHAYTKEGGKRKAARVMAGIFPVKEGGFLHPSDEEPVPPVLMAQGVDFSRYQGMIVEGGGNE